MGRKPGSEFNIKQYNRPSRKKWRQEHAEQIKQYMKKYGKDNLEKLNILKRNHLKQVGLEGIEVYGSKCACCGEDRNEFLTLDHINGKKDESKRKTGQKAWARLKSLGWPKDNYQILCFNCNCAKGIYGICPHQNGGINARDQI